MLALIGVAYAQVTINWTPSIITPSTPITFYGSTENAGYLYIYNEPGCPGMSSSPSATPVVKAIVGGGPYNITIPALPAGTYSIAVMQSSYLPQGTVYSCKNFNVIATPVPETPSTLALLLPALLVGIHVLRKKKIRRLAPPS